jgi:hypothetical protein
MVAAARRKRMEPKHERSAGRHENSIAHSDIHPVDPADNSRALTGANFSASGGYVRRADDNADYARLGIERTSIAPWEDGERESADSGQFEWWYFDAHLDDGTTDVVVFYTKSPTDPGSNLAPLVTINLTLPEGRILNRAYRAQPDAFSATKAGCDVRIGANPSSATCIATASTAGIEDVSVAVDLVGDVPSWRPKSGHTYFARGKGQAERLFAWLPSVPQGRVTIDYAIGNVAVKATGIGYHDHNWGDAPMPSLMHDWYWTRAKVGPYSVVTSFITAGAPFGLCDADRVSAGKGWHQRRGRRRQGYVRG